MHLLSMDWGFRRILALMLFTFVFNIQSPQAITLQCPTDFGAVPLGETARIECTLVNKAVAYAYTITLAVKPPFSVSKNVIRMKMALLGSESERFEIFFTPPGVGEYSTPLDLYFQENFNPQELEETTRGCGLSFARVDDCILPDHKSYAFTGRGRVFEAGSQEPPPDVPYELIDYGTILASQELGTREIRFTRDDDGGYNKAGMTASFDPPRTVSEKNRNGFMIESANYYEADKKEGHNFSINFRPPPGLAGDFAINLHLWVIARGSLAKHEVKRLIIRVTPSAIGAPRFPSVFEISAERPVPPQIIPLAEDRDPLQNSVRLKWSKPASSVGHYSVTVGLDSDFRTVLLNTLVAGTELELLNLPASPIHWGVSACNSGGCSESTQSSFSIAPFIQEPQWIGPVAEVQSDPPVTLTWTLPPGAQAFRVLLFRNDGATILNTLLPDTSHTLRVQPGSEYSGLVWALGQGGGSHAASFRFTSEPAAPVPVGDPSGMGNLMESEPLWNYVRPSRPAARKRAAHHGDEPWNAFEGLFSAIAPFGTLAQQENIVSQLPNESAENAVAVSYWKEKVRLATLTAFQNRAEYYVHQPWLCQKLSGEAEVDSLATALLFDSLHVSMVRMKSLSGEKQFYVPVTLEAVGPSKWIWRSEYLLEDLPSPLSPVARLISIRFSAGSVSSLLSLVRQFADSLRSRAAVQFIGTQVTPPQVLIQSAVLEEGTGILVLVNRGGPAKVTIWGGKRPITLPNSTMMVDSQWMEIPQGVHPVNIVMGAIHDATLFIQGAIGGKDKAFISREVITPFYTDDLRSAIEWFVFPMDSTLRFPEGFGLGGGVDSAYKCPPGAMLKVNGRLKAEQWAGIAFMLTPSQSRSRDIASFGGIGFFARGTGTQSVLKLEDILGGQYRYTFAPTQEFKSYFIPFSQLRDESGKAPDLTKAKAISFAMEGWSNLGASNPELEVQQLRMMKKTSPTHFDAKTAIGKGQGGKNASYYTADGRKAPCASCLKKSLPAKRLLKRSK